MAASFFQMVNKGGIGKRGVQIVFHRQNGDLLLLIVFLQQGVNDLLVLQIYTGGRFVEQNESWISHKSAG